jgi:integral membrane sensor domain MASE1
MDTISEENKIEISSEALDNLNVTWRWTTFLSVLGFIFLGLIIVAGIATSLFLTVFKTQQTNLGIPESLMMVVFVIIGILCYFPVFFLFRFSKNIRDAIQNHDQRKLAKGFRNLRLFFAYFGILVILIISVYLILLLFAGASISILKGI